MASDPRWYYNLSREDQVMVRAYMGAEAEEGTPKPPRSPSGADAARLFAARMKGAR